MLTAGHFPLSSTPLPPPSHRPLPQPSHTPIHPFIPIHPHSSTMFFPLHPRHFLFHLTAFHTLSHFPLTPLHPIHSLSPRLYNHSTMSNLQLIPTFSLSCSIPFTLNIPNHSHITHSNPLHIVTYTCFVHTPSSPSFPLPITLKAPLQYFDLIPIPPPLQSNPSLPRLHPNIHTSTPTYHTPI